MIFRVPRKPKSVKLGSAEKNFDAQMTLGGHLKELRRRLIVSLIGVAVVGGLSLIFARKLLAVLTWPIAQAVNIYNARAPLADVQLTISGVMGSFTMWMKIGVVAGIVLSCPIWLNQLWRFLAPALLPKEKQAAVKFLAAAIPLFLVGVCLGYFIAPNGFAFMLSFNPKGVTNLVDIVPFLVLELRLLLAFGLAFLLPVILINLNALGLIKGVQLSKARNLAIFASFVLAAVITPGGDPLTMIAIGLPMSLMYLFSEIVARRHDHKVIKETK